MKKLIYSLFALAITAMTFTSCEDVPAPYNMPQAGGDTPVATPTGNGTVDDPYNVAAANEEAGKLASGETAATSVYIQGTISAISEVDPSYGNASYYISDDGTTENQFLVYRGYSLGGEQFTSEDEIKVGDKVIVYGQLVNYNGTLELAQRNYIYSLNGVTADQSGTTEGDGTSASPYTASQALSIINSGEFDSTAEVYITGTISQISDVSTSYGNATYYISDDGTTTTQLYVFRGYYLNGDKFTAADQIKVGDKVVILGKLTKYNDSPQVNTGSKLISINGGGANDSEGGVSIDGSTVTLTNAGVTAGTTTATFKTSDLTDLSKGDKMSSVNLSDGSTITFDANGETNSSAYYETDIRVYKNNIMKFACKNTIAKIIITCSAEDRVGNETATVTFDGSNAEYTNVFTGTSGGGTQLRITEITVVYAK